MAKGPGEIEAPDLALGHCSVEEHAEALIRLERLPLWWYQGTSRMFGNFSLPFQDRNGNWWYPVKPGLCWAVDCFRPIDPSSASARYGKTFMGYQHVVASEEQANSHLVINAILDLGAYGGESVNAKRRNAIRKGFKACDLCLLDVSDTESLAGCREAWNDLTSRTGWKHAADEESFRESWKLLLTCPGVSVIVGREKESGQVAGFVVTKIIGDTAYVDTIASRSDMLKSNVNDAVMYAFLINAAKLPGVTKAHYAIRSTVTKLEKFKTGLGFEPHAFPAVTKLRPGVGCLLKTCFRAKYNRMVGVFESP